MPQTFQKIGPTEGTGFQDKWFYRGERNKNRKHSDWLLFLRQMNSTVCIIRTRTIRTFVEIKTKVQKFRAGPGFRSRTGPDLGPVRAPGS